MLVLSGRHRICLAFHRIPRCRRPLEKLSIRHKSVKAKPPEDSRLRLGD